MAAQAEIQNWVQTVYQQPCSLSVALANWNIAPSYILKPTHQLEVALFRAMMDYFTYYPGKCSAVIRSMETHKSLVLPEGQLPSCEISDVLFVSFSKVNHIIRMTHMQTKRANTIVNPYAYPSIDFPLNARQYYLLNNRLPFANKNNVFYIEDTLCNAEMSDSIASYGIFYLDNNNQYNIAYEVAAYVKKIGQVGTFTFPNNDKRYSNRWWMDSYPSENDWRQSYSHGDICANIGELNSTLLTDIFEQELFSCCVGSRIKQGTPFGNRIIANIISILGHAMPVNTDVFDDFLAFLSDFGFERNDRIREIALPQNIVLINSDEARRRMG